MIGHYWKKTGAKNEKLGISENNLVNLDTVLKCNLHILVLKNLNDEQLSAGEDDPNRWRL
jgi:hypothetical protein